MNLLHAVPAQTMSKAMVTPPTAALAAANTIILHTADLAAPAAAAAALREPSECRTRHPETPPSNATGGDDNPLPPPLPYPPPPESHPGPPAASTALFCVSKVTGPYGSHWRQEASVGAQDPSDLDFIGKRPRWEEMADRTFRDEAVQFRA